MCKFCTYLFSAQLTFLKNIIYVSSYYSSVFLEQLCHLRLSQPHHVVIQADINLRLSVFCLIDYNLVLFHFPIYFTAKLLPFLYIVHIFG